MENWKKNLSPDLWASLNRLQETSTWTTLKIPVFLALWLLFGTIAVKVDSLAVRIPCWLVIGFVLHGLGVFMHEGAHGSLFRKGPWDRAVGFLCGLPVFFPCSSYRATHLLHHRYENTLRDPDNLNNFPVPVLRTLIFYTWFLIGMPVYIAMVIVLGPFRAEGWRNKALAVLEPLGIAAFYVALFRLSAHYSWGNVLLNGWALALPFTVLIANFRGLAEHTQLYLTKPPDPLRSTRSLPSNAWVGFFFNNQNYHLEHHLFPRIPWNHLGKVHEILKPLYREKQAAVCKSYWEWARHALRYGPERKFTYDAAFRAVPDRAPLPAADYGALPNKAIASS